MGMAQEGIQMEKMAAKPKHLIFADVDDASLIAAFKDNKASMVDEDKVKTAKGKIIVEIKLKGFGYW